MRDLVSQGILKESRSPWASAAVIVIKKYGGICFCFDYRRLNQVTFKDAYPLPHVEESLDALVNAPMLMPFLGYPGVWNSRRMTQKKTSFC